MESRNEREGTYEVVESHPEGGKKGGGFEMVLDLLLHARLGKQDV